MTTPYNGFDLPVVGADADTWGGKSNAIFTAIDALLSSPANTIKGNNTGSQVASINLTGAQVTAMLSPVVGDSGSGGTKGLVPAPSAGDAAGQKYLKGDGTFAAPISAQGLWVGSTAVAVGTPRGISMVRNGPGDYTFTMSPAQANANYFVNVSYRDAIGYAPHVDARTKNNTSFSVTVTGSLDPAEIWIAVQP